MPYSSSQQPSGSAPTPSLAFLISSLSLLASTAPPPTAPGMQRRTKKKGACHQRLVKHPRHLCTDVERPRSPEKVEAALSFAAMCIRNFFDHFSLLAAYFSHVPNQFLNLSHSEVQAAPVSYQQDRHVFNYYADGVLAVCFCNLNKCAKDTQGGLLL